MLQAQEPGTRDRMKRTSTLFSSPIHLKHCVAPLHGRDTA